MKTYLEYMEELSSDEVYEALLSYGLFANNLPPCFTSESFYKYCLNLTQPFSKKKRNYISYDTVRNIHIPRTLGIPTPMCYEKLCKCITDNWDKIIEHFKICTENQPYKVSRIHVRKLANKNEIFEMNYSNWRMDPSPDSKLLIGSKFKVNADIAKCFPSIYTHALTWAIVGKEIAKQNQHGNWYNELDSACQNTRYGETNGILIGPHAYNVLSEIILCKVDQKLIDKGYIYTRHIDDYTAFARTEDEANHFLIDLQAELKKYNLLLNHKKTKVDVLPTAVIKTWKRKINSLEILNSYNMVDYKKCQSYCDYAIELSIKENNGSVLNYALKVLSGLNLTDNAKKYAEETYFHLALIYPYLVPLLKEYIFDKNNTDPTSIKTIANKVFNTYMPNLIFEPVSYSLYWCLEYGLEIENIDVNKIIESNDTILLITTYLYFNKRKMKHEIDVLYNYAKQIAKFDEDFEQHWLFVYEVLSIKDLDDEWKAMKKNNISFVKDEYK